LRAEAEAEEIVMAVAHAAVTEELAGMYAECAAETVARDPFHSPETEPQAEEVVVETVVAAAHTEDPRPALEE